MAQAESWRGDSERWGLWLAVGSWCGEPTTSDWGWPTPPSHLSQGHSAPRGKPFLFHTCGVLAPVQQPGWFQIAGGGGGVVH